MYRTVVRPAMLYSLETVTLTKRQESKLVESRMLQFSLGVRRKDMLTNYYFRGGQRRFMDAMMKDDMPGGVRRHRERHRQHNQMETEDLLW